MKIESVNSVSTTVATDNINIDDEPVNQASKSTSTLSNSATKMALDHASGLLQAIVNDKTSDQLIRKIPSDEYLHLINLLDEMISGSIDKHV